MCSLKLKSETKARQEALELQQRLLNDSLSPLQRSFAGIALDPLTYRELKKWTELATTLKSADQNLSPKAIEVFMDALYRRLSHVSKDLKKSSIRRSKMEQMGIRLCLAAFLGLMIHGFSDSGYYAVAGFGMLIGLGLLFLIELRHRSYWTLLPTVFGLCLYNPVYKTGFDRGMWVTLDSWLLGSLLIACLYDVFSLDIIPRFVIRKQKVPSFYQQQDDWTMYDRIKQSFRRPYRLYNNFRWHISSNLVRYVLVAISTLFLCIVLFASLHRVEKIPDVANEPIVERNTSDPSATSSSATTNLNTNETPLEDYYSDWNPTSYSTGSRPAGAYFKPKYGNIKNKLIVSVGDSLDVVLKLVAAESNKCIRYVFIKAGDTFTLKRIPLGHYYIKAAFGNDWKEKIIEGKITGRFIQHQYYEKGDTDLSFYVVNNRYSGYRLKLKIEGVQNSFASHNIDEAAFNE